MSSSLNPVTKIIGEVVSTVAKAMAGVYDDATSYTKSFLDSIPAWVDKIMDVAIIHGEKKVLNLSKRRLQWGGYS